MFYSWQFIGIAVVNKELFKNSRILIVIWIQETCVQIDLDLHQNLIDCFFGHTPPLQKFIQIPVADLGFGKGGCPIHQKSALEGAKPQTCAPKAHAGGGPGASPRKFENLDTL